jgi:formyl-CoA transferase
MQNVAPKLSATPGSVRTPGPGLGQHNEEIYQGLLEFDSDKIAALNSRGII